MIFKPSISLFTGENLTSQNPLCIHGGKTFFPKPKLLSLNKMPF